VVGWHSQPSKAATEKMNVVAAAAVTATASGTNNNQIKVAARKTDGDGDGVDNSDHDDSGIDNGDGAHFIRPSDTSEAHASKCKLVPFRRWLNLTHSDTYIHGPFDFTAVHGRKTRDPISQSDWDALAKQTSMFHNPLPWFDLPSYSIHVNRGVHIIFNNHAHAAALLLAASPSGNERLYP
jgi:hypothetical protein